MAVNSRSKGCRGEREAARELSRVLGCTARRGQQFAGGGDSPDVVHSIDGMHVEVKRTERFNLYDALDQAKQDAADQSVPVVMHRRNRCPWVVVVELDRLPELVSVLNERSEADDS